MTRSGRVDRFLVATRERALLCDLDENLCSAARGKGWPPSPGADVVRDCCLDAPDGFSALWARKPMGLKNVCHLRPNTQVGDSDDFQSASVLLQARLESFWRHPRPNHRAMIARLEDRTRALAARAAIDGAGSSLRQIRRRIGSSTSQSLRNLRLHARTEKLFTRIPSAGHNTGLTEIAAEQGYADQSHMGREVRRITGASPARIEELIQTDIRDWFYRLFRRRL